MSNEIIRDLPARPTLKQCRGAARRFVADHVKTGRQWHMGTLAYYMPVDYVLSHDATDLMDAPTIENVTRFLHSNAELPYAGRRA